MKVALDEQKASRIVERMNGELTEQGLDCHVTEVRIASGKPARASGDSVTFPVEDGWVTIIEK